MRQIVLDTETTGLEVEQQHRVIEIGCVELLKRRLTGRRFHRYLNPERDIDEGAQAVHGLSREQFVEGGPPSRRSMRNSSNSCRARKLVIHNAPFDVAFLDAELGRLGGAAAPCVKVRRRLPRAGHPGAGAPDAPGQRNSLDALCKRYSVDNSHRE